jgi:RNA polymerase sigma-70 factor, ECF subfamily
MIEPSKAPAKAPEANENNEADFKTQLTALIPHIRAFSRMLAVNPSEADDLAQEALAKAWQARKSYAMGTNLKAWAFMIVRNQFYSEKRRSWRVAQLDPEVAERTLVANDDPTAALELNELRMALATLPVDQREALILIGAGGLSYDEAADICNCAVGTMKSRVSRARESLRQMVESGDYGRDSDAPSASMGFILSELSRLTAGAGGYGRVAA